VLQALKVGAQLGRRLAAEVAIFLERLADNAVELCRQFGIQTQGRRGRLVKDGIEDRSNTGAGKSLATGRHLIQDHPERKEVGAGIDVLAERAEQLAHLRLLLWRRFDAVGNCNNVRTMPRSRSLLLSIFLVALRLTASGGDSVGTLRLDASIERRLAGNQTHTYDIAAKPGQFVHVVVNQNGIDVIVTLIDPNGRRLVEINRWGELQGPESVSWIAESGVYKLEIRAGKKEAPWGHYKAEITELRDPTPTDRIRIAAERAYAEGDELNDQGTEESKRKSIGKLEEALQLWRSIGDDLWEATTLLEIGVTYYDLGDLQKALDYYGRALPLWDTSLEKGGKAMTLSDMGRVYDSFGQYQSALDVYDRALALSRAGRETLLEAFIVHNTAMIYGNLGEEDRALRYFNQSLDLNRRMLDRQGEAHLLHHIGEIYLSLGNTPKALEYLDPALKLSRTVKDRLGEATTLDHIGTLYNISGKRTEALGYYTEALQIRRASGYALGEAQTLRHIADVHKSIGDERTALEFYHQSLRISRSIGDRREEASALLGIANLDQERGNLAEARTRLESALSVIEPLRSEVRSEELRASYVSEVMKYYEAYIDVLMQLYKAHPNDRLQELALEVNERARARSLLDILTEARANIREGVAPALLDEEQSLQHLLAAKSEHRLRLLGDEHSNAQVVRINQELESLADRLEVVQAKIRSNSPSYAALTEPALLSTAKTQELTDSGTLLLEYALGQKRSYVWAVSPHAVMSFELPGRSEIEACVHRLLALLTTRNRTSSAETRQQERARVARADQQYPEAAFALSRMLLAPIADLLQKGQRLALVTDGALQYVPFAALPVPRPGPERWTHTCARCEPLVLNHEIANLPSASVLQVLRGQKRVRPARRQLAMFADPVFSLQDSRFLPKKSQKGECSQVTRRAANQPSLGDSSLLSPTVAKRGMSFSRLLFSGEEADAVLALVPSESRLDARGFLANVETATNPRLGVYRTIHFSTHGVVDSRRPERSGLILSLFDECGRPRNGFLGLTAIYNLRLNADLVVLSACNTALGREIRGEGLVGMVRGFMYAGAPRVLASQWEVDDASTANLMSRFYRAMFKQGLRPAAALRVAQIEMWRQNQWRMPFYWAGFVMQGDWN
jgi:CHAT domain-containing protein/predicted negative regulator of RcsB-dependent stress response